MLANNSEHDMRVIYNRGNHETRDIYMQYGFGKELASKLNNLDSFMNFVSTLSSAVIVTLTKNNMRLWLSHGGIPYDKDIYMLPDDNIIYIDKKDAFDGTIPISGPDQIRWNDCEYCPYTQVSRGQGARNIGYKLNHTYILDFCRKNKIAFIIRGHQDNYANAYLLSNNEAKSFKYVLSDISDKVKYAGIRRPQYYRKNGRLVSKGPICTIDIEQFKQNYRKAGSDKPCVYPVLTISTNTDNMRMLDADSCIELCG
jgi:hypothetical protein